MFNNIAFSGGGTHTLAFIGCIKYLEEHKKLVDIKNVIGASGGSIIALLVVLNWSYDSIYAFVKSELISFVDNLKFPLTSIFYLSKQFGMNDGNDIVKLIEAVLRKSNVDPNITFLDLSKRFGRNLIIATTNLTEKKIEYLSIDTYPEMRISTAIRMSVSIPVLFTPVKYYEDLYVDSLIYNNFPVNFFEQFKVNTLGFNIVVSENSKKINCFTQYLYSLYTAVCDSINKKNIYDFNFVCNIFINSTLTNFDYYKMKFNVKNETINELINAGYESISKFFIDKAS